MLSTYNFLHDFSNNSTEMLLSKYEAHANETSTIAETLS